MVNRLLSVRYEAEMGQDTLHAHVAEASAQLEREAEAEERFGVALKEAKVMWDLIHRLHIAKLELFNQFINHFM